MWYTPVKGDSKMKKYIVKLTKEERKGLQEIVKTGKTQAYKITHPTSTMRHITKCQFRILMTVLYRPKQGFRIGIIIAY